MRITITRNNEFTHVYDNATFTYDGDYLVIDSAGIAPGIDRKSNTIPKDEDPLGKVKYSKFDVLEARNA